MALVRTLAKLNPDMTICYVSGMGTDSSEKGRVMWARVKGKTENDLMRASLRGVYMFRPGSSPTKGLKHTHWFYRVLDPLFRSSTVCSRFAADAPGDRPGHDPQRREGA